MPASHGWLGHRRPGVGCLLDDRGDGDAGRGSRSRPRRPASPAGRIGSPPSRNAWPAGRTIGACERLVDADHAIHRPLRTGSRRPRRAPVASATARVSASRSIAGALLEVELQALDGRRARRHARVEHVAQPRQVVDAHFDDVARQRSRAASGGRRVVELLLQRHDTASGRRPSGMPAAVNLLQHGRHRRRRWCSAPPWGRAPRLGADADQRAVGRHADHALPAHHDHRRVDRRRALREGQRRPEHEAPDTGDQHGFMAAG